MTNITTSIKKIEHDLRVLEGEKILVQAEIDYLQRKFFGLGGFIFNSKLLRLNSKMIELCSKRYGLLQALIYIYE